MMHAAGLDPQSMPGFFEKLKQKEADLPEVPQWISTHPEHDARIQALSQLIQQLPPVKLQPLTIDWDAVQKHVAADPQP